MTNNTVSVCANETNESCQLCGKVEGSIGLSEWAEILCNGGYGIRGMFVKVEADGSMLQVAEVKIFADGEIFSL